MMNASRVTRLSRLKYWGKDKLAPLEPVSNSVKSSQRMFELDIALLVVRIRGAKLRFNVL